MQNSNLSSKIYPNSRENWLLFIQKVEKDLQNMITSFNNDKRRLKDLLRIINKTNELTSISKDNMADIMNYKELFMYIDNSLESSFDALEFFKKQDNLDNVAIKAIYERIVNSPKIMKINSEYNSLTIKVGFDKERIKRLGELIRGSKVDYSLIKELVNKYNLDNDKKKSILLYPVLVLSIKQDELNNSKDNIEKKKEAKEKFYYDKFTELSNVFYKKKEELKDLLIYLFNVREKMDYHDIDMYTSFINNPTEANEFDFSDDIKFKIYTLSFFKIKKDIESFIDGISDLILDENDLDDELVFFQDLINEFNSIANKLNEFSIDKEKIADVVSNNVFYALDAFNRLIVKEDILSSKNVIKALLEKNDNNHMQGVDEGEKLLGKSISLLKIDKMILAYVNVGKNILIIADDMDTSGFEKKVNRTIERNIIPLKRQISLIEENNLDYLDLQNRIINNILEDEKEQKAI